MSFNSPSYLYRNRHGVFYFRVVIPKGLRHYFTHKREIKRSLRTENKHVALKLARVYMVDFDKLAAEIRSGEKRTSGLITFSNVELPDGTTIEKVDIEHDTSEEESKTAREFLSLNAQNNHIGNTVNNLSPLLSQKSLKTVCDEYFQEKIDSKKWNEKTTKERTSEIAMLKRVVGSNTPISSIDRSTLNDFKKTLLKLPSNINKDPRYRDKSITEIIAMSNKQLMEANTSCKYLALAVSVFNWATDNKYLPEKITNNFPTGKDKNAKRKGFSKKDLNNLFGSHKVEDFDKMFKFWLPLIGLYTGARLNEICQMDVSDISMVNDIPVFLLQYNEDEDEDEKYSDEREGEKTFKTEDSQRILPIHPNLIDIGLFQYIDFLKGKKQEKLFPELKYRKSGGYGAKVSEWFRKYGIEKGTYVKNKKVFHSFRHTLSNHLKQKGIPISFVSAIIGHKDTSMTFGQYAEKYGTKILQPHIEKVDFGLKHDKFYLTDEMEVVIMNSWKN